MQVNRNSDAEIHNLPGLKHQTLAGKKDGLNQIEVWRQTISAGSATPVHRHNCEEAIVIFSGNGVCRFKEKEVSFSADDTLLIPQNAVHQIINTGDKDLEIMATLAMAPVEVQTESGEAMNLPWDPK